MRVIFQMGEGYAAIQKVGGLSVGGGGGGAYNIKQKKGKKKKKKKKIKNFY
jgi:hypothetical protein